MHNGRGLTASHNVASALAAVALGHVAAQRAARGSAALQPIRPANDGVVEAYR